MNTRLGSSFMTALFASVSAARRPPGPTSACKPYRTSDRCVAKLRRRALIALGATLVMTPSGIARAEFSLSWFTIDGGGHTFSAGGAFAVGGTVGQPDAGVVAGGDFVLSGGFWPRGPALSGVADPLAGSGYDPGRGPSGDPAVGVEIPTTFRVVLGRANPFQQQTEIGLDLPESREVALRVFDHGGRLVRRLYAGRLPAGYHLLRWNGTDGGGRPVPSGSYLLQLRAGDAVSLRRVVLLR